MFQLSGVHCRAYGVEGVGGLGFWALGVSVLGGGGGTGLLLLRASFWALLRTYNFELSERLVSNGSC